MMTAKIQIIIGIILIVGLIAIINMIRKRRLELKYALSWLAAIVFVLILDCFPTLLNKIASMLGIWAPVNMIFFLGFCFSLMIIFVLTVTLSRMSERVRKLSQAVALNEEKIEKLMKEKSEEAEIIAYRVRGLKRTFSDDMKIRENVSLEEEFNIQSFSDLQEALSEKPEIAFITNPTKNHIPCAIECAKACCHIL